MGRKIGLGGEVHPNHPIIYFLFLTAWVVAIVGIVSSLCGLLERIKGSSEGEIKEKATQVVSTSPNETENTDDQELTDKTSRTDDEENILQQPLPPPPAMRAVASHNLRTNSMAAPTRSNSSLKTLQRKLSTSMSMKTFSGALSHRHDKINSKLKHEDSIWKKQIILGEKCKVPNQDDDDDTILYDEDGNRISTYHPKQLNVMSMSRQSSEIDPNAIPK
ncbi:hypothetical protein EJD97_001065 [Solanum chilense]|uniref:Uncharacterized protein n=2 Tax=Solanum subgen. Lycopersicon TaxID=49274 RepID=A0A3Q7GP92_SOLLC|nr:hypothetical protein EJD97_001065 [Solanum chilense]